MSTEQMRKLMEAASPLYEQEVNETFVTEPMEVDTWSEPEDDKFRDEEPALPLTVVANVDIPAMYMNAGDELYLKPTNNHGQVYSEENGLTYEWDFISHLANDRNMLEIKHVGHDESEIQFEDEGSEEFKRGIQNPQWRERDAEEERKRSGYLAKIAGTGREDDLRYARVNTKKGKGTVYSINNMTPTDPSFPYLTVSVRLDSDPGPAGGGQQQHRWLLSDVTLLPEEDTQIAEAMQRPQLSIPPTQKEFEQAYQQLSSMCDSYEVMIQMQKERVEELEATLAMYEGKD